MPLNLTLGSQLSNTANQSLPAGVVAATIESTLGDKATVRIQRTSSLASIQVQGRRLSNLPVIGGTTRLKSGDTVYVMQISPQEFIIMSPLSGYSPSQPVATDHIHEGYLTLSDLQQILGGYALSSHTHSFPSISGFLRSPAPAIITRVDADGYAGSNGCPGALYDHRHSLPIDDTLRFYATQLGVKPNTFAPETHVGSYGSAQHALADNACPGFMPALNGDSASVLNGQGGWSALEGVGLHKILRIIGGVSTVEYEFTNAGFTAALSDASSGSQEILLPLGTIVGGPWVVSGGNELLIRGSGRDYPNTTLQGNISAPDQLPLLAFQDLHIVGHVAEGASIVEFRNVGIDTSGYPEAINSVRGVSLYYCELSCIYNSSASPAAAVRLGVGATSAELLAYNTRFRISGSDTTKYIVSMDGTGSDAYLYNCIGQDGIDVSNDPVHCYVDNFARGKTFGSPFASSTAAWDTVNYPSLHSSDLSDACPTHHNPLGISVGDVPTWDGGKWVSSPQAHLPSGIASGDFLRYNSSIGS